MSKLEQLVMRAHAERDQVTTQLRLLRNKIRRIATEGPNGSAADLAFVQRIFRVVEWDLAVADAELQLAEDQEPER